MKGKQRQYHEKQSQFLLEYSVVEFVLIKVWSRTLNILVETSSALYNIGFVFYSLDMMLKRWKQRQPNIIKAETENDSEVETKLAVSINCERYEVDPSAIADLNLFYESH